MSSNRKHVTVKRRLETSRTENIEVYHDKMYNDTIENFLNSQNNLHSNFLSSNADDHMNETKPRYDRSGSPLKRSVLGSIEMFEKERVKRTTFLKQSGKPLLL